MFIVDYVTIVKLYYFIVVFATMPWNLLGVIGTKSTYRLYHRFEKKYSIWSVKLIAIIRNFWYYTTHIEFFQGMWQNYNYIK